MTHDGLIEEDQAVSDGDFVQRLNAQAGFGPQVPSIPAEEWLWYFNDGIRRRQE